MDSIYRERIEQQTKQMKKVMANIEKMTEWITTDFPTVTLDEIRSAVALADAEMDKIVESGKDTPLADLNWEACDAACEVVEDNALLWISFLLEQLDSKD